MCWCSEVAPALKCVMSEQAFLYGSWSRQQGSESDPSRSPVPDRGEQSPRGSTLSPSLPVFLSSLSYWLLLSVLANKVPWTPLLASEVACGGYSATACMPFSSWAL